MGGGGSMVGSDEPNVAAVDNVCVMGGGGCSRRSHTEWGGG